MNPSTSIKNFKIKPTNRFAGLREQVIRSPWSNPDFLHFLIGDGLGTLGNYFYQIALPGLMLELTGSASAIATPILISGIARISLMILGGNLSDVFSPKLLTLIANAIRLVISILLAGLVASGRIDIATLLGFSFVFGASEAIASPARSALPRWLVPRCQLYRANAIALGQEKLTGLSGPLVTGVILTAIEKSIWLGSLGWNSPKNAGAIGVQFLALAGSLIFLLRVKVTPPKTFEVKPFENDSRAISWRELLIWIFHRRDLCEALLMVFVVNIISTGPLFIGLPILTANHFSNDSRVLGLLMSSFCFGSLLGAFLPGLLPKTYQQPNRRIFGIGIILLGANLAILFTVRIVGLVSLAVILIGIATIYMNLIVVTRIQLDTPPAFLGRMMSLVNLK